MTAMKQLNELLARSAALLLDFDGPVCSIFAGHPAPVIAGELVDLLQQTRPTTPRSLSNECDPLEVLRWVGAHGSTEEIHGIEKALCAAELRAAETAEPTPFAREAIVAAGQTGVPIVIVSNNSADAIDAYLTRQRLAPYVLTVVGRTFGDPGQMKPHPAPILRAARSLGVEPSNCLLVGDSMADIEGARAAGGPVIGYANRPDKAARFRDAGADLVVTSMRVFAEAFMEPDSRDGPTRPYDEQSSKYALAEAGDDGGSQ